MIEGRGGLRFAAKTLVPHSAGLFLRARTLTHRRVRVKLACTPLLLFPSLVYTCHKGNRLRMPPVGFSRRNQMNQYSRKTLEDFPKFHLSRLSRGETSQEGFTAFELEGEFDRPIEREEEITWFWLLIGERAAIRAQWKSFAEDTRAATLVAHEKELPEIAGKTLYYLGRRWDPYQVWMVLDEQWGWERVRFQAVDAVAETYEAKDISIIDGRPVKTWTKMQRADKRTSTTRYAPAVEQSSPSSAGQQVIPGGWDHEHCQLCRGHIDHDDIGYRDRDELWMCENCYDTYVKPHDLSFVGGP